MQNVTAKGRFEKLHTNRSAVLQRARDCSDLTIPSLLPPEGSDENTDLPTPYQSLGSRGVNNLTSKLRLALFPPGNPFFRFQMDKEAKAVLSQGDPNALNAIESGLRGVENDALSLLETENHSVILSSALKQLVTAGNCLLVMPDKGGSRIFRLPNYVVLRDAMGAWYEIVTMETVNKYTLDPEIQAKVKPTTGSKDDDDIEVYTWIKRIGDKVEWHQEINDEKVEGSEGRVSDYRDSPYIPLRWSGIEDENYGRGHVEEYLGDLRSLEDLSKAIVQFSAVAAKIIFLDAPNSSTDIKAVQDADSGDFVEGRKDDISVLQLDKYPDFQVTKATLDEITLRLSHAFLLQSGTVRNAERVTAEEIRQQAQELEDVLGGVYTVFTQELQLPVVRRLIYRLKKLGKYPNLPKGTLNPTIVTGFEALGRGHELNRFRSYFSDGIALFGPGFMGEFSLSKASVVLSTHHNVDIGPIKKTDEEKQMEQQAAQQQQLMDKAAGPVAGAIAGAAAKQPTE